MPTDNNFYEREVLDAFNKIQEDEIKFQIIELINMMAGEAPVINDENFGKLN